MPKLCRLQPAAIGIRHTGAMALAPDPFGEEIERLLVDPDVQA
jgi:hypothetical protein